MTPLQQFIRDTIEQGGPITFERFMELCLYHPSLGYYTSGRQRIGARGDYYTAPYASSILSMVLTEQIAQFFDLLGRPAPFHIVEVGAGSGRMADDILESMLRWHGDVYDAARYVIVEKQEGITVGHPGKIEVRGDLSGIEPFTGCIISNELFDALPVHLVVMGRGLYEVYVAFRGGRFEEVLMPAGDELAGHLDSIGVRLSEGVRTEVNLGARRLIGAMASSVRHGYVLTIDYGYTSEEYYSPSRTSGTLVCYHGHRVDDDPYELAGEKDITSHVDFTSLAKWGREFALDTVGYVRQRDFVLSLGYDDLLMRIKKIVGDPVDYYRLTSASKFLVMPEAMGDVFKVLLQYRGDGQPPVPAGFARRSSVL
ncbi:MAG: SAM-dependent methyltransferase [Deltaproteobacteria bacterium]|nr:SAM-dependent methyltransferase [Deltaproteobacteria bacterium]